MALLSEMHKLTLNILDDYDDRMAEVAEICSDVRQELASYRADRQAAAHAQRQQLADERTRLAADTTAFCAELDDAHLAMANEQQKQLAKERTRFATDTVDFRKELNAAHQAMAHGQKQRLDEQRARLASDTAAFRTDVSVAHKAMAAEQRQRLSDQQVQIAADVASMRHKFQTEQSALREEQAEAHQVWSNFNTIKRQNRSKRYVTEKTVAEPPPAIVPAKGKITAEDLTVISGIGSNMEKRLNQSGIFTFAQLAASTPEKLRQVLGNTVRLAKVESWIAQARDLTI